MAFATYTTDAVTLNKTIDAVEHRHTRTLERDLQTQTGAKPEVFNFSTSGAMVSDDLLISRALFRDGNKPKLVILSVNPRDFVDACVPSVSSTEPFGFFSRYVSLNDDLSHAAFNSFFDQVAFEFDHLALKKLRQTCLSWIESRVPVSKESRVLVEKPEDQDRTKAIFGGGGDIKLGDFKVYADTRYNPVLDNTCEYMRRYRNPNSSLYKRELIFFKALLADLREKKIATLVIGMPSYELNRFLLPDKFWNEFNSTMQAQCKAQGADWLDLSSSKLFELRDYLDYAHLNYHGGAKLLRAIAAHVAGNPQLASSFAKDIRVPWKQDKPALHDVATSHAPHYETRM
jgi:hypothetical protein